MVLYGILHTIHGVITILHSTATTTTTVMVITAVVYGEVATGEAVIIPAERPMYLDQVEVVVGTLEIEVMEMRPIFLQDHLEANTVLGMVQV